MVYSSNDILKAIDYIINENIKDLEHLLEDNKMLVNSIQEDTGKLLLHYALSEKPNINIAKLVLPSEENLVNQICNDNTTPLFLAVQNNVDISFIKELLKLKASPSFSREYDSILYYACCSDYSSTILLKKLLNAFNNESDKIEALNYLFRKADDDEQPFTILDLAKSQDIITVLLDHGAAYAEDLLSNIKKDAQIDRIPELLLSYGYKPKYPVILLPGIYSTALDVWESTLQNNWENTRLWVSPAKLGGVTENRIFNRFKGTDHTYYEHTKIQDDGISDPEGIKVRPVDGLNAIGYLLDTPRCFKYMITSPIKLKSKIIDLISHKSVVWGDVITTLKRLGYTPNNLQALPYDWRLAPMALQERDNLFTKLKYQCENLVEFNKEKVVLFGHSMGCKLGQYFLLWISKQENGIKWIQENIEAFVPIGAPWLGAPKLIRALVAGDSMDLPLKKLIFGEKYMACLCRTFSSTYWLVPFGEYEECVREGDLKNNTTHKWKEFLENENENSDYLQKYYYNDPNLYNNDNNIDNYPSHQIPPEVKLYCIYGYNSPERPGKKIIGTEVGAFYNKLKNPVQIDNKIVNYELNKKVSSKSMNGNERFLVEKGIIKERPVGDNPSGDGTVPYESVSYSKKWAENNKHRFVKHYEMKGVPHRETVMEPSVLFLLGEIVCGGVPKEILHDTETPSIFRLHRSEILKNYSNDDGIPYCLTCVIASLENTNGISDKKLLDPCPNSQNYQKYGELFLRWKEETCSDLDSLSSNAKMNLLKEILFTLALPIYPIINPDKVNSVTSVARNYLRVDKMSPLRKKIIFFFRAIVDNKENGIDVDKIVDHFYSTFIWISSVNSFSIKRRKRLLKKILTLDHKDE